MTTTDASKVMEMAETTAGDLTIAAHERNYTKLVAHVEDGQIDEAYVTEDINEYDCRDNGWVLLLCVGTGSVPCNCDACSAGDNPSDWADGDTDAMDDIVDRIQRKIDEVVSQ